MKTTLTIAISFLFTLFLNGQGSNPEYDSTLARRLGADDRGMKMYVLVILRTGPNTMQDSLKRAQLFAGHFNNINMMADLKKLVVAGPLDINEKSYRGIFILDVPTIDEAKFLLDGDPTIREKIFEPEYYHWYGSAALPEYLEADKKLRK